MALKRLKTLALAMGLLALTAQTVLASGYEDPEPWYLGRYGGGPGDNARTYEGHVGVLIARASPSQLLMTWRSLHGLKVGAAVGASLIGDCCTPDSIYSGQESGANAWLTARKAVPGLPSYPDYVNVEVVGADYSSYLNCFPDAFDNARKTLQARVASYGAASPDIRQWIAGQDAVFRACGDQTSTLPSLPADAPAWLKADHAYQRAALALYVNDYLGAAGMFAAIAKDRASPWAPMGLYLQARALRREALARPNMLSAARARVALDALDAAPAGTYGKTEVRGMRRSLDYRDQPAVLLRQLDGEMNEAQPKADIAVAFRDYRTLAGSADPKPELAAWLINVKGYDDAALTGQALTRWKAGRDNAWLLAALAHVNRTDPEAPQLIKAARGVAAGDPAWLSAQYHEIRLTIGVADPGALRARLDAILARRDLTANDRALFTAERLQVASSLEDFVRLSMRRHMCGYPYDDEAKKDLCGPNSRTEGVYQLNQPAGFGNEARAIIDRLPLAERMQVGSSASLPADLRLDVTLTNYARAVQLQDDGAVDILAKQLVTLLPVMAADFRRIPVTAPGPDKRFAELFAMSKIPGLTVDLATLRRPVGRRVASYQGEWRDWLILPRGRTMGPVPFRPLADYEYEGVIYGPYDLGDAEPQDARDARTDLTCLGLCGDGAFPLHPPAFAAAGEARARSQRAYFVTRKYDDKPDAYPPGTSVVWDDFLAYAQAHPRDPRTPEALYWITRMTRWGVSHNNRLGYRAFRLLHQRYPGSEWAKRARTYYD